MLRVSYTWSNDIQIGSEENSDESLVAPGFHGECIQKGNSIVVQSLFTEQSFFQKKSWFNADSLVGYRLERFA
ncbi:hypothetical protein NECAME_06210 [Necator americanus]|uniref:Uncharacterized protein n=1 Tax=Necator americanus TaxID=51031 RepID=W2TVI0_NECAM|nr:hypothetical protein NECAME_06210 [Necator americanus]ETN85793.1 hypothetical protein NECAME_06210 [Necator americanus]